MSGRTADEITTTSTGFEMLAPVAFEHTRTQRSQPLGCCGKLEIRPTDRVALIQQDFGDTAHTNAADADEMNVLNLLEHGVLPLQKSGSGILPLQAQRLEAASTLVF